MEMEATRAGAGAKDESPPPSSSASTVHAGTRSGAGVGRTAPPFSIPLPPTAIPISPDLALFSSPARSTTSSNEGSVKSGPVAPDLSSATTRMYPIRNVMYPSSRPAATPGGSDKGSYIAGNRRSSSAGTGPSLPPIATPISEYPPPSSPVPTPISGTYTSLDPFLSSPTSYHMQQEAIRAGSSEESRSGPTPGRTPPEATTPSEQSTEADIQASVGASLEMLMTTRFEHSKTKDGGEWVITGRGGVLQKCEDEPIHAPGAIQAFGVLLCFDEDEKGNLVVQQVSENSRFILGLPPSDLLHSSCLTNFFDEDETDAIRDALDALDERDADPANLDHSPLTFQLSGVGLPGTGLGPGELQDSRTEWTCHCAIHRPNRAAQPNRAVLEFELMDDQINPLTTIEPNPILPEERVDSLRNGIEPTEEDLMASTVSIVKPLRTMSKRKRRQGATGRRSTQDFDVVGLLGQINEQLGKSEDLEEFLKIVAGVFKELTEADRTMIYQFDEVWNGRVVAEQVDWTRTKDLFRGLNFPASDIPAQARDLYKINKVRILYDRDQPTARMCCRSLEEVENPLNMTHCHLRAMSPIHIKYLSNMGVRSSMSVSITAFGDLWGLIAIHTYGKSGHRVSFPVRQLCKLLGDSISRNIERLSYAKRLKARKLINTAPSNANPSGYIVAKAEDLLALFDADFGILSIGEEAKILGEVENSQELLVILEFLRQEKFTVMQKSQDIRTDFPSIDYPHPFEMIAGLLCVPLSSEGKDFIVFFRRGQLQEVHWAGNPYANKLQVDGTGTQALEPRKSFASWSETVVGKCRAWSDEQAETAGVLCLVYGKFIDVWRQKETALAANKLTTLLLANASHEVRTPLNAIINYLELALDGPVEGEVRENLTRSHAASRSLIHVINDLLDLTRTEQGNDLFLQDPFNLPNTISEAIVIHKAEAERRGLTLDVVESPSGTPQTVLGDRGKIRLILTNVVANAVKHTETGGILIEWGEVTDANVEDALDKKKDSIRLVISITDTGVGISDARLESIFREFEQVGSTTEEDSIEPPVATVGLGLAVVARIVRNLGGQLRVESKVGQGSKFTFTIPFRLPSAHETERDGGSGDSGSGSSRTVSALGSGGHTASATSLVRTNSSGSSQRSQRSDIDSLITAMSASHMDPNHQRVAGGRAASASSRGSVGSKGSIKTSQSKQIKRSGEVHIEDSHVPLRAVKVDPPMEDAGQNLSRRQSIGAAAHTLAGMSSTSPLSSPTASPPISSRPGGFSQRGTLTSDRDTPRSGRISPSPSHISEYRPTPKPSSNDSVAPMRILVVEDELVNRLILQKRLKKDGHEVITAEHGGDALRLLEKDPNFDLILMDLQMPICDGYEASLRIRRRETLDPLPQAARRPSTILNGRLPILAVSASLHERQKGQLIDAGIDGFILKPVDTKRLNSLMRGALDLSVRRGDIYQPGHWEAGGWMDAPIAVSG